MVNSKAFSNSRLTNLLETLKIRRKKVLERCFSTFNDKKALGRTIHDVNGSSDIETCSSKLNDNTRKARNLFEDLERKYPNGVQVIVGSTALTFVA
jgi:hypothetical protein